MKILGSLYTEGNDKELLAFESIDYRGFVFIVDLDSLDSFWELTRTVGGRQRSDCVYASLQERLGKGPTYVTGSLSNVRIFAGKTR